MMLLRLPLIRLCLPLIAGGLALTSPAAAQDRPGAELDAALGAVIESLRDGDTGPRPATATTADDTRDAPRDMLGDSLRAVLGPGKLRQQGRPEAQPAPEAVPVITADTAAIGFLSDGDMMPSFAALPGIGGLSVVVELFTAQGCGNCPPVDAMVATLDERGDVLPLSFHVDYWDYLGWADSFADADFTARQKHYAWAAGERAVYTPQIIVDGQDTALSLRPAELMALVDDRRARPALIAGEVAADAQRPTVTLTPLSDIGGPLTVTLVHYLPWREVRPEAGENSGRTVGYRNVVAGMDRLIDWDGAQPVRLRIDLAAHIRKDGLPADARHAVLIQRLDPAGEGLPGPILGALRLD